MGAPTLTDTRQPAYDKILAAPKSIEFRTGILETNIDRPHPSEPTRPRTHDLSFAEIAAGGLAVAEGQTIGDIAETHEFGIGVPQRSFIRGFVDNNETQLNQLIDTHLQPCLDGTREWEPQAEAIALRIQAANQAFVRNYGDGTYRALADSTIADKKARSGGKDAETPLIFSGVLLSSITADSKVER